MTQDEVIRMAVQCQLVNTSNRDGIYMDALQAFAKLVAAKEREACAKLCDSEKRWWDGMSYAEKDIHQAIDDISASIRARGEA